MKKHRGIAAFLITLLVLIGVVLFALFKFGFFAAPPKQQAELTPKKVGSNSSVSSSSFTVPSASKSPDIVVADTGKGTFVQIKSKGSGPKFQDLSYSTFHVYRAHNPKVMKTATKKFPNLLVFSDLLKEYPHALMMNASGYNFSTLAITGFQVNNGQVFQDWGSNFRAKYALGVFKDGSIKAVTSATPASQLISEGLEQTYSFGSILVNNGQIQPDDGSMDWEVHCFIGTDMNNNVLLFTSEANTWNRDVLQDWVKKFNLKILVDMDGGGSTRLGYKGQLIFENKLDDRKLGDYMILE